MAWMPSVEAAIVAFREEIDSLKAEVRSLRRAGSAPQTSDSGTRTDPASFSFEAMSSIENIVMISITGPGPPESGSMLVKAIKTNTSSSGLGFVDDTDFGTFTAFDLSGGAFVGAVCFARWVGNNSAGQGMYVMFGGEINGFQAKLSDAPDSSFTYGWDQVNTPLTPLSSTSTGLRAQDRAVANARDTNIALADRIDWPIGTQVTLHWSGGDNIFYFSGGAEPTSALCAP